ncbi:Rv0804 family intramembrane glutamic endopeptidase [Mycobacterium sp. NPDC003449]
MTRSQFRALSLAVGLVAVNGLVDPALPARWRPLLRAVLATGLLVGTGARPGLRPPELWSGLRLGGAVAGVLTSGIAATTAVPVVRTEIRRREPPSGPVGWLLLGIPVGTVWSEEAAFRGALAHLGAGAFGPAGGQLLQATAFGLSHVADARGAGEPVLGTVLVTGAVGWLFGWLAQRSGSLAAPILAHLSINEAGAVAALAYRMPISTSGLL